jgi:hypothetical protein
MMNEPWDTSKTIDSLFTRLNKGVKFAAADGDIISDAAYMLKAYSLISDSGVLELACREWRLMDAEDKTKAECFAHFKQADLDRLSTTGTAGYHMNVLFMQAAQANAIAIKVAEAQAFLAQHSIKPTTAPTVKHNAPVTPATFNIPRGPDMHPKSYCWMHGLSTNPKHNSATCNNRAVGHIDTATENNKQGGSEKVWAAAIPPTQG